ncbi:hypothetical protein V8Z69_06020 [Microbacterium aurugineum]|uniref:hypothetical protein n=1 Tax=Microbacterium TaxID=33882 RepID=UPI001E602EA8|nr:hypothetical protein [Microbacterium sp. KKR3/1]MCE0509889.1 hypothetical protein [Microbacterium sp. KKR3/1]
MFAPLAFFSFVRLGDRSQHAAYNRWHQLDHRPENLALPGVAWGDRWEVRPEYAGLGEGSLAGAVDFVAMYWFRDPVEESVAAWDALGEASFQWGRGPLIPGIHRPLLAFFRPVKGYAAPRALVAPEVLPYRPHRGIHVTATRFPEPHSAEAHAAHRREDRELIPALLELDGVAGAWTFSYSHPQRHSSLPFEETPADPPGSIRIRLVYLEEDPADMAPALQAAEGEFSEQGERLLSTPVKTIIPWQDW